MSFFKARTALFFPIALLILFLTLLVSCTPSHPQSTFDTTGPVAEKQLTLFLVIFWAAVFVFVTVEGILLYTVIRFRRKPGQGTPPQIHGHRNLEIAWTIAPAIVLAVIAVPTVTTIMDTANTPDPQGLKVDVIGHQWWWEFNYPEYGVVTANELHIPVDQVVNLTLRSEDVIHSFWIPKIAGKVDVISILPGYENTLWIKAEQLDADTSTPERDAFYGLCAEFCGIAHAHMRFRVIVETQEEFENWVTAYKQAAQVTQELTDEAKMGLQLFTSKGCVQCHTVDGPPKFAQIGPNLTLFGSKTSLAAGVLNNTPENIARWLRNPNEVKKGNRMYREAPVYQNPDLKLTDDEILALVSYLQSLK